MYVWSWFQGIDDIIKFGYKRFISLLKALVF